MTLSVNIKIRNTSNQGERVSLVTERDRGAESAQLEPGEELELNENSAFRVEVTPTDGVG